MSRKQTKTYFLTFLLLCPAIFNLFSKKGRIDRSEVGKMAELGLTCIIILINYRFDKMSRES